MSQASSVVRGRSAHLHALSKQAIRRDPSKEGTPGSANPESSLASLQGFRCRWTKYLMLRDVMCVAPESPKSIIMESGCGGRRGPRALARAARPRRGKPKPEQNPVRGQVVSARAGRLFAFQESGRAFVDQARDSAQSAMAKGT